MRKALIVIFMLNLILTAVSLALLPDQMAIHFGGGGRPDSWASKEFNATVFLVLEVPFFLMFYLAPMLPLGTSNKYLSLPNKDFWLQDENRPLFHRKFSFYMAEFGVAIFILFFCINLLVLQANLRQPVLLNYKISMTLFIVFMSYTLWWLVRLIRGFRVPAG